MATSTQCPNCNTPVNGPYCSNCGQIQKDMRRFFLALFNEAFEDLFSFNSRAWKTIFSLLFKPGFLTNEYLKGRRVSYVQPVRLYFISSIFFFLLLSIINFFSTSVELSIHTDQTIQMERNQPSDSNAGGTGENGSTKLNIEAQPDEGFDEVMAEIDANFDEPDSDLNLPFISPTTNARLKEALRQQLKKAITTKDNNREIISAFLEIAPPVIFCLLPLFALLLKIIYVFRGVYYSEHLVFAVHNHCFVFLTLALYSIAQILLQNVASLGNGLNVVIGLWLPIYLWLSLRNVYKQGRFITSLKFIILGLSYSMILALGILAAFLAGIFTL